MSCSGPTLHPPVLKERTDIQSVSRSLASLVEERQRRAAPEIAMARDANIRVPIDSVSKDGNFDAYIHIGLVGSGHPNIKLLVDFGNSTLILPQLDAITRLLEYKKYYKIEPEDVKEPWGATAKIVTGPIVLPCDGGTHTISNCRFYACTGLNDDGCYTANFGIGRVDPWSIGDLHGLQSPLSYSPDHNFVQIDYAPIDKVVSLAGKPQTASGSSLTLSKAMPDGFTRMLKIRPNMRWMALRPQFLDIGGQRTGWPGKDKTTPIAMVDTGGGPVFLSDPENYVRSPNWPNEIQEAPPDWVSSSVSCKAISDDLSFSLTDGSESTSFSIATNKLTSPVRGLSLVMCEKCHFMWGQDGMNIGGLTALFYSILIDYKGARVGFKSKPIEAVIF